MKTNQISRHGYLLEVAALDAKLKPTGMWRTITEKSVMSNNDEWVSYSEQKETQAEGDGRLVLSRPVYEVELREGLQITTPRSLVAHQIDPQITLMLDAFVQLRDGLEFYRKLHTLRKDGAPWNAAQALATIIGNNFYDCMSGGWSVFSIWAAHQLSQGMDMGTRVYPQGTGYITLKDFIKETKGTVESQAVQTQLQLLANS